MASETFRNSLNVQPGKKTGMYIGDRISIHVAPVPAFGCLLRERRWNLPRESVHLWWTHLDQWTNRAGEAEGILSPDERAHAGSIKSNTARRHFMIRRILLRVLLGAYLDREPSRIPIDYGRYGKPFLDWRASGERVGFSVSYCDDLVLFGFVRGCEIGVDMERIQTFPEMEAIIQRHATPGERKRFGHLAAESKERLFFQWWTRKEAVAKASGCGLNLNLEDIETASFSAGRCYMADVRSGRECIRCYRGHDVALLDGVAASAAVGPIRPWARRMPAGQYGRRHARAESQTRNWRVSNSQMRFFSLRRQAQERKRKMAGWKLVLEQ